MFCKGFEKIADNAATGGTNNQGLEFQSSDKTNTSGNVGPGGMTPQGIDSYQPAEYSKNGKHPKKLNKMEVGQLFMHKGASAVLKRQSGSAETNNVTKSHKYDKTTVDATHEDFAAKNEDSKARYRAYLKASLK